MPIKKLTELDPNKVQTAIDKFWQDTVNSTLSSRGLLPAPETEVKTSSVLNDDLIKAKWFEEWQVGIPWVNVIRASHPELGGNVEKPLSGLDTTQGQDLWQVAPTEIIKPEIQAPEPTELQKRLGEQVDVTKTEQANLERQKEDVLSRFEWQVSLDDLKNLNKNLYPLSTAHWFY